MFLTCRYERMSVRIRLNRSARMPGRRMASSLALSGVMLASAAGLTAVTASTANAATCNPRLSYEYNYDTAHGSVNRWSNFCGYGPWRWNSGLRAVMAIRMPTAPYHRVWFHENSNGRGATACFYSRNRTLYMKNYTHKYGAWIWGPASIQVSRSTAPC